MAQDRKYFEQQLSRWRAEKENYVPHWRELSEFTSPRTSRFLVEDRSQQGTKHNSKILDNTSILALRTLSSGMMSGITNPARPWVQYRVPDPDLNKYQPVRVWLDAVRRITMEVFLQSNLYTVLPQTYSDLGLYGTHALCAMEDATDIVRFYSYPIGSYSLGASHRGTIDTIYREFQMNVGQIVARFGEENCSERVLSAFRRGDIQQWVNVAHGVEPNQEWDGDKLDSKYKRFRSVYWEIGNTQKAFLEDKGYDEFPVMAPRWQTVGEDIYGISPGMDALGVTKGLQVEKTELLKALKKKVSPPVGAPTSLRNKDISLLPNGVTFYDAIQGQQKVEQLYQVNFQLNELQGEIQDTRQQIRETFFADLFLLISSIQEGGHTMYEVARKEEEKLLALGPVYLRINDELLDPLINRTFNIMLRAGILPPPPPEIREGMQIIPEYISIMSQTMKAIGITSIERTLAFAGNIGGAFPSSLDKFEPDAIVDEYAEMAGVSPKIIRDDKSVKQLRAQRIQQEKAQQALAMAQQGAETANKLATAPMPDGGNVLANLVQNMRGAQGVPA